MSERVRGMVVYVVVGLLLFSGLWGGFNLIVDLLVESSKR